MHLFLSIPPSFSLSASFSHPHSFPLSPFIFLNLLFPLFPFFHFLTPSLKNLFFCFFLIIGHILIFSVIIFSDRFYSLFFVNFSVLVFIQFLRFFVFCSSFLFFSLNKLYYSDPHTFFFFKFSNSNSKIQIWHHILENIFSENCPIKKIRKKMRYFKSVLFTEIKTLKE